MALTLPKLPLHKKILLALILGAAFGVLFSVSTTELVINHRGPDGTLRSEVVEEWDSFDFVESRSDSVLVSF